MKPLRYALTLHQPWAWSICHAGKRVENREWAPHLSKGDVFAIHAGQRYDREDASWIFHMHDASVPPEEEITKGAVVAVVRLGDVLERHRRPRAPDLWHAAAKFWWQLSEVIVLPSPVACRGKQKLWVMPDDVLESVVEQWGKVDT